MTIHPDSFSVADLQVLRNELRNSGLDSFQCAELIGAFLHQRGYGVSAQDARSAVARMESLGGDLAALRQELHGLALMM